MKYFISVDMEGVGGVSSSHTMKKDDAMCRNWVTQEVNSVIEGILEIDKNPHEILVCDSHNEGENILPDRLNPIAFLVRGFPRNEYMMTGIDDSFDLAFFVGYHAKTGEEAAVLDHTFSGSRIQRVEINGRQMAEFDINAGLASHYKVPVGFLSGDDKIAKHVSETAPWMKTVITKYGIGRSAAKMIHPEKVRAALKAKASEACRNIKEMKPLEFKYPLKTLVDFRTTDIVDLVCQIPELKREGGKRIVFESTDFKKFYDMFSSIASLAHGV